VGETQGLASFEWPMSHTLPSVAGARLLAWAHAHLCPSFARFAPPPSRPWHLFDRTMYASKNHLWVWSAEEHLTTSGNGIIATFVFKCVLGPNGSGPIVAKLEYASRIGKIFELNFEALNIVVFFLIGWKQIILKITQQSKEMNTSSHLWIWTPLFPFLTNPLLSQFMWNTFFFSNDPKEKRWKIVLHKDPCWRWVVRGVEFDPIDLKYKPLRLDYGRMWSLEYGLMEKI
jgi:hypothetical protein